MVVVRRRAALAVVSLVTVAVAACGSRGAHPFHEGDKRGTGERRTDAAPLTKRFPALGEPDSVEGYSGTLGDPDVPGPSAYWIDARVTLSASGMDALLGEHPTAAAPDDPDVVTALRDGLDRASLRSSADLDEAFSTSGFTTHVWVDPSDRLLVLSAKGQ